MIGLTMKHLRYFEALARHLHFGRAAEDCAVTQPALSMQIKELEALTGALLVERGARALRLTPLGEDFATRARAILASVDELGDLVRAAQGPGLARLRIGVIPTIAPYLLPGVITALGRAWPGIDLRPREAVTRRLIADLDQGRLDCAIVALPVSEAALHEEPLFDEDFVLVRPLSDAARPVPDAAGLRAMRLLLLEEGHCFRDQALSYCGAGGAAPRDLMEGSSLSTLVQMVGAGIGVTLIPEMALPVETRSAAVALARLPEPRPSRRIGLIWRHSSPLAAQLHQVAAILRERAAPR
ncbi:MAG: LysR family transcriptional regulator, partial [Sphingomonadales bacterium]|nr:LysR family transcriptional regulator [Sphingomonadales bacterium]